MMIPVLIFAVCYVLWILARNSYFASRWPTNAMYLSQDPRQVYGSETNWLKASLVDMVSVGYNRYYTCRWQSSLWSSNFIRWTWKERLGVSVSCMLLCIRSWESLYATSPTKERSGLMRRQVNFFGISNSVWLLAQSPPPFWCWSPCVLSWARHPGLCSGLSITTWRQLEPGLRLFTCVPMESRPGILFLTQVFTMVNPPSHLCRPSSLRVFCLLIISCQSLVPRSSVLQIISGNTLLSALQIRSTMILERSPTRWMRPIMCSLMVQLFRGMSTRPKSNVLVLWLWLQWGCWEFSWYRVWVEYMSNNLFVAFIAVNSKVRVHCSKNLSRHTKSFAL